MTTPQVKEQVLIQPGPQNNEAPPPENSGSQQNAHAAPPSPPERSAEFEPTLIGASPLAKPPQEKNQEPTLIVPSPFAQPPQLPPPNGNSADHPDEEKTLVYAQPPLPSREASIVNKELSPSARIRLLAPEPDNPFSGPAPLDPHENLGMPLHSGVIPIASSAQLRRVMGTAPVKPPDAVLEAKGLRKKFGKREVVCGVDLQVGRGEIVGLLGRNGAGKTTTFRMIMGLLHPDGGSVSFEHRDVSRVPMYERANRGIGYLAQQPSVFQRMTVAENLLAVLELQEPSRQKRNSRVEELIKKLGLEVVRNSQAAVLSGGERRRLEIARAMSLSPKIVLFDEPFAGIDPIAVNEIQGILRVLKGEGVGVLVTDHNVRETLNITDRTYIMDEGKIWIHGAPREIVENADAKARYLGQEFRLDF
jgi:lipopolysaccharide export system ATP-binding protein